MKRMMWLSALALALVLSGCGTSTGGARSNSSDATADRPLLELPPANEAEAGARVHVELGTAYFEIGRYDVALDEARIALLFAPGYAPAYHLMGLAHMFIDDTAAARENFLRALRVAPNDPDFNNSYGWFLCLNGDEKEGLRRLELATRNPYYRHPSRAYTNAGLCELRGNDVKAAQAQFRRAIALQADNVVALFGLAEVSYRTADYATAQRQLVALHRQTEPTAQSAWLGLRVERRLGNREAEASYAAQLTGRFKDSPEYQAMIRGDYE